MTHWTEKYGYKTTDGFVKHMTKYGLWSDNPGYLKERFTEEELVARTKALAKINMNLADFLGRED